MGKRQTLTWGVGMVSLLLVACNSGGGSSSTVAGVGLEMPTEISAVPASGGGSSKLVAGLMALGAAADPGTDYSNAQTVRFVNEPTLEQFEIIEEILAAIAQTHYADSENIGTGPYKAMVAFQDEQNGIETKTLEPWIVQSDLITENGQTVNRLRAWIEENMDGQMRTIKAEVKIYEAATKNADGSYADYGVWTINAKFDDTGTNFFAAEASRGSNGETVLTLHERMQEGSFTHQVKAYLNKSDTNGYGRVDYPDWSNCMDPNCVPGMTSAAYAYNATHLGVQKEGQPAPTFKNRTAVTEMTHRYGVYDAVTGEDVRKTKSFGFPVAFTDSNGGRQFAYYGAWQGRHQLWAGMGTVPEGTVVTRQDRDPANAPSYTVSAPFVGTLVKRTAVAADIDDIRNIPVETWVNSQFNLVYNAADSKWYNCINPTWGFGGMTCGSQEDFTPLLPSLVVSDGDMRKFVNINRWDQVNNQPVNYLYIVSNPGTGAGNFFVATMDANTGRFTSTGQVYTPSDGDQLWANIGGSIYIEYTGAGSTGWVEKTLSSFDQRTWTPVFDDAADKPYTLPLDREFYINLRGANYIVKRTNSGYDVKIEIQTVANPVNASTFVPNGMVFKSPWNPTGGSTYEFITDPNDPKYMKLVYRTVGDDAPKDAQGNASVAVGDVVTSGQWGLMAYDSNNQATGVQYNWDYPRDGENWGTMTYLLDANGQYVLLSDPIRFASVELQNKAGQTKTLSLQYDGWMHGLPDLFDELRKNNFVMTQAISDKIINIPAGTQLDDADDSTKHYVVKPLEVSEFLAVVADPGTLDLTTANAVDLDALAPNFVEHNMGATPNVTTVKYSEGNLVE